MTASKYFNDHWTLDDGFGMGKAGDVLARMALEVDPPFSIRVTGKWGSGKTSVLRRAFATLGGHAIQQAVPLGENTSETDPEKWTAFHFKERLKEVSQKAQEYNLKSLNWTDDIGNIGESSLAVWYSPWQHQNADNPLIPLLLEIQAHFTAAFKIKGRLDEFNRRGGLAALTLLERVVDSATNILFSGSGTNLSGTTDSVRKAWQEAAPNLTELTDGQRFHLLFEHAVKAVISGLSGQDSDNLKHERLIIFIDDLDRCEEKQIIRLLEGIKLYLECSHCVFVLGMDDTAVMSAVCRCWEGRTDDDNREYLEKMFQATVSVPLPRPKNLQTTISQQLTAHDFPEPSESAKTIEALLEPNPRKIKNFCNSLCASWGLFKPRTEANNLSTKFILLHYLRTFHNSVWRLLERQPCAILFLHRTMANVSNEDMIPAPEGEADNPIFEERTQRILQKFFRRAFSHILPHDEKATTTEITTEHLHLDIPLEKAVELFTDRQDRKRSDEFFRKTFRVTFSDSDCLEDFFLYLADEG